MRIVNGTPATPVTAADKSELQAVLAGALAGNASPTFDEIRAALPAPKRARATDAMIHMIALELGLKLSE